MRSIVIMDTQSFTLTSYGNGLAYCLTNKGGRDIFVQGDSAAQFREELDALENANPERASELVLLEMFNNYNMGE